MRPNAYTDAELNKVRELRAAGKTWTEVAAAIGRNHKSVYLKFHKMGEIRPAKVAKRKYTKKPTRAAVAAIPAPTKPMVAFIGTPQEITASIRELFS